MRWLRQLYGQTGRFEMCRRCGVWFPTTFEMRGEELCNACTAENDEKNQTKRDTQFSTAD